MLAVSLGPPLRDAGKREAQNPKCCIYRFWTADSESHPFLVTGHKKEARMGDARTFLVLYITALITEAINAREEKSPSSGLPHRIAHCDKNAASKPIAGY